MKTTGRFTFTELFVALLFIAVIATIGIDRYNAYQTIQRDLNRKVAINTIHHNLLEIVKPSLGGYPKYLSSDQLSAMDSSLLKDPNGKTVNSAMSDYRYEPTGCNGGELCSGYTLRANLENEVDFVRTDQKN